MNTAATLPQDYRSEMQQHALTFLQRHQGEHLLEDGRLFERATDYLVHSLDVPAFLATTLVHLAQGQLKQPQPKAWIGIDHASGPDQLGVVLIDNRTGQRAYIPRRILPERFLAQTVAH